MRLFGENSRAVGDAAASRRSDPGVGAPNWPTRTYPGGMPCAAARRKALEAMIPAVGTQKPESYAKKWRKIHWALDAVGGRVVTIMAIASLDLLQAQSIWEMSVK